MIRALLILTLYCACDNEHDAVHQVVRGGLCAVDEYNAMCIVGQDLVLEPPVPAERAQ